MALSADLISQFVKMTKDETKKSSEATVYGTVVSQDTSGTTVQLDGSSVVTPVNSTVKLSPGERVVVSIKNHTATVMGNLTTQAARTDDVDNVVDEVSKFEIVVTDQLDAAYAHIETLVADNVTIKGSLEAAEALIGDLEADNVVINEKLTANEAEIETLKATSLTAEIADLKYATIDDLEAVNAVIFNLDATYATIKDLDAIHATIEELEANQLTVEELNAKYANIDFANIGDAAIKNFFAKSGMVEDLVVSDGRVTGTLVGVTIIGDYIKGGTIQADKLVIKGEDGLYYKLNVEGGATTSEEVSEEDLQNGLSGSIIVAKSITAEKVAVDDLVAFDATIGGFHITDMSLYSGAKASATNTTRGVYLDSDGQFAVGDSDNYLKFYKDTDGKYKLAVSVVDKLEVGGRNYLLGTGGDPQTYTFSGWQKYLLNETQGVKTFQASDKLLSKMISGQTVTLSADIQNTTDTNEVGLMLMVYTPDTESGYRQYTIVNSDGIGIKPGESGRAYITATLDVGSITSVAIALRHNDSTTTESTVIIDRLKLELGNKPTDWTPAPEDVDDAIIDASDSIRETMVEQDTAIVATCEELIMSAAKNYVETGDYETFKETVETQLSVMAGEISMNFTSTTENIANVDGELQSFLTTFSKFIKFTSETAITIGSGNSEITLEIDNDTGIVFKKNGVQFGWWDGVDFHTGNIVVEVNERAQFGNFAYIPRSDGSLSFLKVGE